jgi:hypothetical protein
LGGIVLLYSAIAAFDEQVFFSVFRALDPLSITPKTTGWCHSGLIAGLVKVNRPHCDG